MLATDYRRVLDGVAGGLFARWCQENFFQYMGRHYGLDKLVEYGTEPLPETTTVVNPAWRRLDQAVRRERAQLQRSRAQFGALSHRPQPSRRRSRAMNNSRAGCWSRWASSSDG